MEAEQGQFACLMVPALATSLLLGEEKGKTREALCLEQNPLLARPAGAAGEMQPLVEDDYTLASLLAKDRCILPWSSCERVQLMHTWALPARHSCLLALA